MMYGDVPMQSKRVTKGEVEEALSYLVKVPMQNIKYTLLDEMPNMRTGIPHACAKSGVTVLKLSNYPVRHVIVTFAFCNLCGKLNYFFDREQIGY